jgi:hypothetical protein
MKNLLMLVLSLVVCIGAYAQSSFQPGYFIDDGGNRVECFIKNFDKKFNPSQFEYKLSVEGDSKLANIHSVREFGIYNTAHKYQFFTVNIDRSSNELNSLDYGGEPVYKKEKLFLRVLVSGEATLYSYYDHGPLERFYFSMRGSDPEPLVYKKYLVSEAIMGVNEAYKSQLMNRLICPSFAMNQFEKLRYQEDILIKLFISYNSCIGSEMINHNDRKSKGKLGLTLKTGLNSSVLEIDQKVKNTFTVDSYHEMTSGYDRKLTPQLGFEIEYVFPFYNSALSVLFEPTFQYYQQEYELEYFKRHSNGVIYKVKGGFNVNYSHMSLPVGLRHTYDLNGGDKLFVNGALGYNFLLNNAEIYRFEKASGEPSFVNISHFTTPSFIVGLGYKYRNKVSFEAGYHIRKYAVDSKIKHEQWRHSFKNSFSVVLGYTIL